MDIENIFSKFIESKKMELKISSISNYYQIAQAYLFPLVKGSLNELTRESINEFLCKRKETFHLSDKSMYDIKTLLNAFLKFCYANAYIKQNIAIPNKKPKSGAVDTFTDFECQRLEKHLIDNISYINLGILISFLSGLRIGEVCALKWEDIDLERQIIRITKTLERIKNVEQAPTKTKIIIDSPKSINSVRDIPIPGFLVPLLKKLKGYDNWYILTASKSYMEPRLLQKKYKVLLADAGIAYKNFKTLRHTFATNALRAGMDAKTLSELMGHENAAFTLKVYVHSSIEVKRQEINSIYANHSALA